MNQAKPGTPRVPPPKQKRAYIADVSHACQGKCPCGGACILRNDKRHQFHTCNNEKCRYCHELRFKAAA
jgi:hypothetical protein